MKKKLIKRYPLNHLNKNYSLLKFPQYIVINDKYDELLILDNELTKVKTVKAPLQKMIIHYTYYHSNKEQVLFQLDDDDDSLLLFNIDNYQFKLIQSPELSLMIPSTKYTWNNNTFYVSDGIRENILEINTSTLDLKVYPFENRFKIVPELAKKIEIMDRFHCNRSIPGKPFFASLDCDNTKTIKIINFQGELIKTISIANELDKELNDKVNPIVYAEKIPHEIRYQDGWFIIIWEKKIVVVSPEDNRITLYPKETFMLMRARFTKTTETSA